MISIRNSMDNLEWLARTQCEEQREFLLNGYSGCLQSAAEYAVAVEPAAAAEFSRALRALAEEVRVAATPADFETVETSTRGLMSDYRDLAGTALKGLRQDLSNCGAAMALFADTVAGGAAEYEAELRNDVSHLESLAACENLTTIRNGIRQTRGRIIDSYERMQRSHQMVIAQLRDEIRTLHGELKAERDAPFLDPVSGLGNRRKIDERLAELARSGEPHCLLLVWLRNLKQLENAHLEETVERLLKTVGRRLRELVGHAGVAGRWSPEEFVLLLEADPARGAEWSRLVTKKLNGKYRLMESGQLLTLSLEVTVGMIKRE